MSKNEQLKLFQVPKITKCKFKSEHLVKVFTNKYKDDCEFISEKIDSVPYFPSYQKMLQSLINPIEHNNYEYGDNSVSSMNLNNKIKYYDTNLSNLEFAVQKQKEQQFINKKQNIQEINNNNNNNIVNESENKTNDINK